MQLLQDYFSATHAAIRQAANTGDATEPLLQLCKLEAEIHSQIALLERRPSAIKAAQQHATTAATLRAKQRFVLSFAGGGTEEVTGWTALANRIRLRQSSIRVLLSKGKGKFPLRRANPITGEPDILTVLRVDERGKIAKPKIGRPRTRPLTEAEYNALHRLA